LIERIQENCGSFARATSQEAYYRYLEDDNGQIKRTLILIYNIECGFLFTVNKF